jgi:hypothetical protein
MKHIILSFIFFAILNNAFAGAFYPGVQIGNAQSEVKTKFFKLENNALAATWIIVNQKISFQNFLNKETGLNINFKSSSSFFLEMEDGQRLYSKDFKTIAKPIIRNINGLDTEVKLSNKYNGKQIEVLLFNKKSGLKILWEITLKDDANYFTQKFTLLPKDSIRVKRIGLVEIPKCSGLKLTGEVVGSPLAGNNFFCAVEHPMSLIDSTKNSYMSFIRLYEPVTRTSKQSVTAVWGVSPKNQLRRSFLYYIERERAVPYHQKLHYISWFDLSWIDRKLNETSCMDRIQTFADSLIVKRNVKMDAFLFDDGWDNNQTLWQFNGGFPNGFANMSALAKKHNADLGVWISPWGGYEEDKNQRLIYGRKQNPPFETNTNGFQFAEGFSLSGPVYYKRFYDVVSNFVKNQGVSMFKFDGVGWGNDTKEANDSYGKDIHALLKLVPDLRNVKPDLFFSLTVGTWPSPYWLKYGDVIWRSGDDTGYTGDGSMRQQWLNYRDSNAYSNIVKRGKLFPLNSLMYHGIIIADHGKPATFELNDKDIADEIWSFFATGTNLQELYINPHKLNKTNWNCLAKAIHWAKDNEDIMVDTHWVGGSPQKGQVYGFASWSPQKAILSFRNPSSVKQSIKIDVAKVFEIPENHTHNYSFFDARAENNTRIVAQGNSVEITLEPFEVKVFNAYPEK